MASGDAADSGSEPPPSGADPALAKTVTPETQEAVTPLLIHRPDVDQLARQVARTRIANSLFAKHEQVRLGRYHLLELVGSGGMGVVWGAWDPELERRVAIKLVKATVQAARDRILLEGQALAKLSHPNVVPVYDVGVVDEQVYIVMEWVRGENLRAYCKQPRTIREILTVYRAAGDGLRAAHEVGLIHRDFKPDNAMRGDDGRVRVLDFGLARGEVRALEGGDSPSSDATRGAGTPRYMPPEQAEGRALGPAVDQFAFCASLREAVVSRSGDVRRADVPGWIDKICTRGTAADPKDRFASMGDLLHALARDPATIWRRRFLVGGAAIAIAAAFVIGNVRGGGNDVEHCVGGKADVAKIWNDRARAKLVGHLQSLGAYGTEEADRITKLVTSYGERWALAHHNTCLASERGELTPQLYEKNLACLTRDRAGFETVIELLSTVTPERFSNAIVAARGLPDAERCAMETATSAVALPAKEIAAEATKLAIAIERARVLAQAGDPAATAEAKAAVTRANALAYAPLVARASLTQGLAQLQESPQVITTEAIPILEHAGEVALEANDDVTYIEAFAREVFAIAVTPKDARPAGMVDVLGAIPFAERIANRLGSAGGFARALLFNNIGIARMAAGDQVGARGWFKKAIDEPRTQEGEVELVNAFGNLALAIDDPAERDRAVVKERTTLERMLGANHVMTLRARLKEAHLTTNPIVTAAELRQACGLLRRYHSTDADNISLCSFELGWLAEERGDLVEARSAMLAVEPATDVVGLLAGAYLELFDGKTAEAAQHATDLAKMPHDEWWERRKLGDAALFAAICFDKLGRHDLAIERVKSALAIFDDLAMLAQMPYHQRRIARSRALLAKLVAASDPAAAKKLAADAIAWYRAAGGYDRQVELLDALVTVDSH